MNVSQRVDTIKNWIIGYVNSMPKKAKTLVVGVSGGIDSAVVSTISSMTGIDTIVLSMPIKQIKTQDDLSKLHCNWLVENFKKTKYLNIDLDSVFSNFEAAWTGSEGGLYVSKNGQAYNLANFSPNNQASRAAEELVSNTDGQTDQATDGISTGDLSSVFHIPLIDLNGTEAEKDIVTDVDYDAGTFTEGDIAGLDIVNASTVTTPDPENPEDSVFHNGLLIKDYININDPDNITTATNANNSGVVSAGSRLATATVTLTNAYDDDELLVNTALLGDGTSTTLGKREKRERDNDIRTRDGPAHVRQRVPDEFHRHSGGFVRGNFSQLFR